MKYITKKNIQLSKRASGSHKGENGTVLIIGGSIDYVGALLLAGMAAFRAGADLVVFAAPEKVAWAVNTFSPDFITFKFKGDYFAKKHAKEVLKLAQDYDVVLIGNGIGRAKQTEQFVKEIVPKISKPKVIDANAVRMVEISKTKNAILTPHKDELKDFVRNNKLKISKEEDLKSKIGDNVIIVTGKVDKIISKEKVAYNNTGNAGMTVGGTGDVMAGLSAGLLAQLEDKFKAGVAAAYINGKAGDNLQKKKGNSFIASELLDEIPKVLKTMQKG